MADVEDTQTGEPDPNLAPENGGEAVEGEIVQTEEGQTPTVEELAKQAGWTPKEEFKGNPEKWRPAHEYLLAGKNAVRNISSELKAVREQVSRMTSTHETLLQEKLREQEERLLSQRREAIEAGDADAVDALDQQRERLRFATPAAVPPSEVEDFKRRNEWFGKDPMATNYAIQVCELNKNLPAAEQVRIAEEETRKRFPEHFPVPAKQPPLTHRTETRTAPRRNGKKGFNDLPREAQDAARKFEENHGVPKDRYAELFFQRQEKVG